MSSLLMHSETTSSILTPLVEYFAIINLCKQQ